jgi:hypothetical protein
MCGVSLSIMAWGFALIGMSSRFDKFMLVTSLSCLSISFLSLCFGAVFYYDSVVRASKRKAAMLATMLLGVVCGPFAVVAAVLVRRRALSQKARAALVTGGSLTMLLMVMNVPRFTGGFTPSSIVVVVCGGA